MPTERCGSFILRFPSDEEFDASGLIADGGHVDDYLMQSISCCADDVPVVLLLGWAGCQDRYLKKYSAIYDKKCITLRFTSDHSHNILHNSRNRTTAMHLAKLLVKLHLQTHPLFVHTFSNGGGRVYRYFTEVLNTSDEFKHLHLVGTMFDSCPSKRSIRGFVRVFLMISNHSLIIKYIMVTLIVLFFYLIAVIKPLARIIPFIRSFDDYVEYMQEDPAKCPQLYLYSTTDKIVPFLDIEKQISFRRKLGIKVLTQRWDDSPHCTHLVTHREVYITTCLHFVESCMANFQRHG